MRKGLHPLSIHLGMAAVSTGAMREYASHFQSSCPQERLIEMVRGIKLYQSHSFKRPELETESVWCSGTVRVLKPEALAKDTKSRKAPILLVPSLINKSYILDLSEERSLLRWLNKNGIDAYLLDWGDLASEEASEDINLNELVKMKLCASIRELSIIHGQPVDVLGYCMGGTLLVAAHHFAGEYIRRMVFLAAPWDFHVKSSGKSNDLARAVRIWSPMVLPVIKEKGVLPSSYVQALFASLGSDETVQKFIRFSSMDQATSEAYFFVSVEDWLNDDVDIPARIAEECIKGWFLENSPANGRWVIDNTAVNPANIESDVLIIASKGDKLVPYECAIALKHQAISSKRDVIEASMGHIGLIVGNNAIERIWDPMLEWLKS